MTVDDLLKTDTDGCYKFNNLFRNSEKIEKNRNPTIFLCNKFDDKICICNSEVLMSQSKGLTYLVKQLNDDSELEVVYKAQQIQKFIDLVGLQINNLPYLKYSFP